MIRKIISKMVLSMVRTIVREEFESFFQRILTLISSSSSYPMMFQVLNRLHNLYIIGLVYLFKVLKHNCYFCLQDVIVDPVEVDLPSAIVHLLALAI